NIIRSSRLRRTQRLLTGLLPILRDIRRQSNLVQELKHHQLVDTIILGDQYHGAELPERRGAGEVVRELARKCARATLGGLRWIYRKQELGEVGGRVLGEFQAKFEAEVA